tara:strand:+ start:14207 stop:14419 length:213 start_codon:yes stop_codon:yes gene_type:complete
MKKILLRTFLIAVVVVNLLAWLVDYYSDVTIAYLFRFALIMGIMFISTIFTGAALLLGFLDTEERTSHPE